MRLDPGAIGVEFRDQRGHQILARKMRQSGQQARHIDGLIPPQHEHLVVIAVE
jgi:hypothetical protein